MVVYAAEIEGKSQTADNLAFLRSERDFKNTLLVEQPNGVFGHSLMRQFLFDSFHYYQLTTLCDSTDHRIAEIAQKSIKEVTYHLERSSDLIYPAGDGTNDSQEIMQNALNNLWRFTGELITPDRLDNSMSKSGIGADFDVISKGFAQHISDVFKRATLAMPEDVFMADGGKRGRHSEALGPLLAEMQYLQRSFPGATW